MCVSGMAFYPFLIICLLFGVTQTKPVPSSANDDQSSTSVPGSKNSNEATSNSQPSKALSEDNGDNGNDDTGTKSEPLPMYLQLVPAICMVGLFAIGIIFIASWQRIKDKQQLQRDTSPLEDDHFGTIWIRQLKAVRQNTSLMEKIRRPSVLMSRDRQKKYALYDSMLEKYREDIEIKRQMLKKQWPSIPSQGSNKRLRELAKLHRTKSEGGYSDHGDEYKMPVWQQELQSMQEDQEELEVETETNENILITESIPEILITPHKSPSIMNYSPATTQITITTPVNSIIRSQGDGLSYYCEESEGKQKEHLLKDMNTQLSTSSESLPDSRASVSPSDTTPLIQEEEDTAEPKVQFRPKPRFRDRVRPKSWMVSFNTGSKREKKVLSRPKSLLVAQQAIEEEPELLPLDFESLHKYKFIHESEKDMTEMITAVEQQMIKEVVESKHDLSGSEIAALERLLDDVSRFCKDFCGSDWSTKKQYSLEAISEQPTDSPKRVLRHQQSLPAAFSSRRSKSIAKEPRGNVVARVPTPCSEPIEEQELLTIHSPLDLNVIRRSAEVEDLVELMESKFQESENTETNSYGVDQDSDIIDNVFYTDTETETDTASPIDEFAMFSQYPRMLPFKTKDKKQAEEKDNSPNALQQEDSCSVSSGDFIQEQCSIQANEKDVFSEIAESALEGSCADNDNYDTVHDEVEREGGDSLKFSGVHEVEYVHDENESETVDVENFAVEYGAVYTPNTIIDETHNTTGQSPTDTNFTFNEQYSRDDGDNENVEGEQKMSNEKSEVTQRRPSIVVITKKRSTSITFNSRPTIDIEMVSGDKTDFPKAQGHGCLSDGSEEETLNEAIHDQTPTPF